STAAIVVLVLSIIAKVILAIIYHHSNKKTKSNTIRAALIDSRNDAIITLVILIGLVAGENFNFSVDGILGVIVSFFVIRSGFETIRDSVDDLVGARPATEIAQSARLLKSYDNIYGFHDLLLHNYGVKKFFGSVDVEVPENLSLTEAHEIADRIEADFLQKLSIDMIVHVDPVGKLSPRDKAVLELVKKIVSQISPDYKIHSFVSSGESISLTLDLPSEMGEQSKKIIKDVESRVAEEFSQLKIKITLSFDDFLA
ncbi:MAG: cation diffusion facilitator family transporter, partial [Candidatus Sacchiramonaceae bacterium]|nr:cation diffusion facilitator family transporter [Candidatus Saccharimonadaceae bacterium]